MFASAGAIAQVCAPPASLVTAPSSGVVNNYYAGNGNLSVGATSITLGALRGAPGLSTPVAVGDLLMVIQMQDGTFTQANNNTYGNSSGSGAGTTSVGRAGLYEFVRVTSAGGTVGITPPLANGYVQAAATSTSGQKTYQVLRVAQYSSLTAAGITAPAWNGTTGGVTAVDVQNTLTLGNATVEGQTGRAFFLAGKGFRGGAGRGLTANGSASTDYMTLATADYHGSKGEGIAGTPFFTATQTNGWMAKTSGTPAITIPAGPATSEGYPGGSYAAGAPGNAGGGGTDGGDPGAANQNNAGGGGGGNYAKGGIGGRPWANPLKDTGGRGGAGYAGTLDFNRVFLGGGGGAGGTNNSTQDTASYTNDGIGCGLGAACSSGAAGGGIVIIRAKNITGSGIIDVRGAHSYNVGNDASGGGGAGGTVVLQTINGGNATVQATGGDGGNAWAGNAGGTAGRHGPGGAGGGGFVAFAPTSLSVSANVNGGAPGRTQNDLTPEDSYGSTGFNGGLTTFRVPDVPGAPPAATCDPSLSLVKTDGVTTLASPGTNTYTFTVTNAGSSATSGTVSVADKLPAGLSVVAGPLTLGGPGAAAWACTASNTTDIYCASTASIAGNGGTSSFAISTAISAANGTSVANRARVAGGGDPAKALPATPADAVTAAAACTANNNPAGCALDTDTVSAPNLSLTKTDNADAIFVGGTTTYALVAGNQGSAATSGTIRIVDVLPGGLQFNSTAFTVNGFTCNAAAQVLTCDRATALAAGATATVTFTVTVLSTAGSSVFNKAQVGGGGDPSALKSGLPTATTVGSCPAPVEPATTSSDANNGCAADLDEVRYIRLELAKDDGKVFVSSGGSAEYAFTVTNVGNMSTSGVISVRDALTGTMTVTAAITPGGANGGDWACVRVAPRYFNCTSSVPIAAGASSVFTVNVSVGAAANGDQQKNLARVGGGGDVRPGMVTTPTNGDVTSCISNGNPLGCAIDLNTVQTTPEIRVTKSHPSPQARSPGDTFAFTLLMRNSGGTDAATNTVRVVDVVPAGLTINGTPVTSAPFTCAVAAQVVTCNNTGGAFAAGTTRTAVINVTVGATATNELVNRARIGATGDPQNNTVPTAANTTTCVANGAPSFGCATDDVPLNADVAVSKQQRPGTSGAFQSTILGVPVGGTVQYSITVSNNGPSNVTGVTIADTVPTNFSTVTWTCTTTGTATCGTASGSGNEISLTGNVNSGAGNAITVLVTAVAASSTPIGGVTNTVALTIPDGINDTTPANNTSSVATAVGVTNLSITKSDGVATVGAGGNITYNLVASNTGPTPANGARIFDPAVAGLSCTAAPVCTASAGATCPAGLTMAQLQNATAPTGVAIPVFGAGSTVTIAVTCGVTATGL
ncbi:MAG: DUF11 domain-containing protein [Comamonadaceae bacterium]|nr:MAG: DUF11 domain-containing protein [Comamonadaceae bacterium]